MIDNKWEARFQTMQLPTSCRHVHYIDFLHFFIKGMALRWGCTIILKTKPTVCIRNELQWNLRIKDTLGAI